MNRVFPLIAFSLLLLTPTAFQSAFAGPPILQTVSGKVFDDQDGDGINDPDEPGIEFVQVCVDGIFNELEPAGFEAEIFTILQPAYAGEGFGSCDRSTFTNEDGLYSFDSLTPEVHSVFATAPDGKVATTSLIQVVDLSLGDATNVDFGFAEANAPPPEVTISPLNGQYNGLPVVYWNDVLTISKTVDGTAGGINHCGPNQASSINLEIGPFSEPGNLVPIEIIPLSLVGTSPEVWRANVGPLFPNHGTAQLKFVVQCPNAPQEIQMGGNIYIDPSGFVTNACNGDPIVGAEVQLFKSDGFDYFPADSFFFPVPHIPPPDTQTTDALGHYGWDVIPGDYRVDVDATLQGFGTDSLFVTIIDTPVLDANFELTPLNGCPIAVGGENIPIDSTVLILANAQSTSWIIPVVVSIVGIGLVFLRRK